MQPIFTRDIHAPRFRSTRSNIGHSHQLKYEFKRKNPKYKDISLSRFNKIIKTYNELLWQEAIASRDGVELPEELGYICISTCHSSKKSPPVDIGTSIKLGVKVSHQNFGSDSYLAKITYINYTGYSSKYRFENRNLWYFVGCRDFKNTVARTYQDNWKKYIQIDSTVRLNKAFKKAKKIEYIKSIQPPISREYNEFDMN